MLEHPAAAVRASTTLGTRASSDLGVATRWGTGPMPESPLRFADRLPVFPYLDVGNAPEHQQIIRIGSGASIIVIASEATAHIPAMQIE